MARRRHLRPDEKELWQAVARTAKPLHPVMPHHEMPRILPEEPPKLKSKPRVTGFRIGERAETAKRQDTAPSLSAQLAAAPVQMDRKSFDRMSRGKLLPEARLDLHGMTLAEAHPELIRFIMNAHAEGLRLVLVITGKGRRGLDEGPIPQRHGVLKHQVPHWFQMPPLGGVILQVAEAHLRHGGAGAYYVYLRRQR